MKPNKDWDNMTTEELVAAAQTEMEGLKASGWQPSHFAAALKDLLEDEKQHEHQKRTITGTEGLP